MVRLFLAAGHDPAAPGQLEEVTEGEEKLKSKWAQLEAAADQGPSPGSRVRKDGLVCTLAELEHLPAQYGHQLGAGESL